MLKDWQNRWTQGNIVRLTAISFLLVISGLCTADQLSNGQVTKKRHTLKDLRDRYVVKQELDYSCGAAALATLLKYYYNDITNEQEILEILTHGLDENEKTQKQLFGFSLLDLKRAAEKKGYRAGGFKITVDQLVQLSAPVIVYVEPLGYRHFAVLRDVAGDRVLLADPSRGNLRMTINRFKKEWNGIIFVLGKENEENIVGYPLAVPSRRDIQPERLRVDRMMEIGIRSTGIIPPVNIN